MFRQYFLRIFVSFYVSLAQYLVFNKVEITKKTQ